MRTQPPDNAACRALFTELEFTSMLRDLAPDLAAASTTYNLKPTAAEVAALLAEARSAGHLALAIVPTVQAIAEEIEVEASAESEAEPEPLPAESMSLFGVPSEEAALKGTGFSPSIEGKVEWLGRWPTH